MAMGRSVVLNGSPRCERCQLPPRWCICPEIHEVDCPLKVDVLMHHREAFRPSSTGYLIRRVIPSSGVHLYRRGNLPEREKVANPGNPLWILHPCGEPLPPDTRPGGLQVLLLDGSWRQTREMIGAIRSWGRLVRLPMLGESRYWLRTQTGEGNYGTAEALIFLLAALNLKQACDQVRLQFELHVYAGLCSRGAKAKAEEYLVTSPVRAALAETIARLAFLPEPSELP